MIGICGLTNGCGTTCVSLSLCNYLCSKRRKKTAYIELNSSRQIHCLNRKRQSSFFSFMEITIFPEATLSKLPGILQKDYEYFVLDFGILNPYTAYEFSRCHIQFMVGDFSLWKQEKSIQCLEHVLKTTKINQEQVIFLGNPMIKESIRSRHINNFLKTLSVPFISNPFQIASKDFVFYESLLGGK